MPADSTQLRAALRELDEAVAHVRGVVQAVEAGELDATLDAVVQEALPAPKFSAVLARCTFPDPPPELEVPSDVLSEARAREAVALEERIFRMRGGSAYDESLDAAGRRAQRQRRRAVLMELHKGVNAHKYASIFRKPVNPRDAPNYLNLIETPMDLGTIKRNIDSDSYPSVSAFSRDVRLIATNTITFNGAESDYYVYGTELMAHSMGLVEAELRRQAAELLGGEGEDEEDEEDGGAGGGGGGSSSTGRKRRRSGAGAEEDREGEDEEHGL